MRNLITTMSLAFAFSVATPASAQISPVFDYTSSSTLSDSSPYTLGYAFDLTQATTINALGFWTGGTLTNNQVGIWDTSGNLLTSANVTASDAVVGNYAWGNISPLLLGAGSYVIGGEFTGGLFPSNLSGVTADPDFTWVGDRQTFGGFAFPTFDTGGTYGQNGIALVNFSTLVATTDDIQDGRLTVLEASDVAQNTAIGQNNTDIATLEANDGIQDADIAALQSSDSAQSGLIAALQSSDAAQYGRLTAVEATNTTQGDQIVALQTSDAAQDTQLSALSAESQYLAINSVGGTPASAAGANAIAIGNAATASGTNGVAIGNGAANGSFANSVALGSGTVNTAANQVSVGGRTISGVANGVAATDAVNVSQLNAATAGVTTNLAALNGAIVGLQGDVATLYDMRKEDRKDMRQGIASALALPTAPMPSTPGGFGYAVNGATFRGEYAAGASLTYRLNTAAPTAINVGVAVGGNKNNGARIGVSGEF